MMHPDVAGEAGTVIVLDVSTRISTWVWPLAAADDSVNGPIWSYPAGSPMMLPEIVIDAVAAIMQCS
jgi:hypothetical protein